MNSAWLASALQWLVIPVLLAAGGLLLLAIPARISRLKRHVDVLQKDLGHLQDAQQRSIKDMQSLNQRLDATQGNLDRITLATDQLALNGDSASGYTQAIRLVERGATLEDLVAACGLSANEARLILDLHGRKDAIGGEQTGGDPGS